MSRARTEAAIAATMLYAAERAAENPVKLAKATRTVRAGLTHGHMTLADLLGDAHLRRLLDEDSAPFSDAERARIAALLVPVSDGAGADAA